MYRANALPLGERKKTCLAAEWISNPIIAAADHRATDFEVG